MVDPRPPSAARRPAAPHVGPERRRSPVPPPMRSGNRASGTFDVTVTYVARAHRERDLARAGRRDRVHIRGQPWAQRCRSRCGCSSMASSADEQAPLRSEGHALRRRRPVSTPADDRRRAAGTRRSTRAAGRLLPHGHGLDRGTRGRHVPARAPRHRARTDQQAAAAKPDMSSTPAPTSSRRRSSSPATRSRREARQRKEVTAPRARLVLASGA